LSDGRIRELDGLRAVAVVPVIALHFGAAVDGGAGVTVFFALSGFLMATLLTAEHGRQGSIDVARFYVRRFRRLLPAATTVIAATVIVGRIMDKPPIGRSAVASLTYWANFERYASHYTYGQTAYAPLEHFWSLAIEEQFYVVLPLACILLLPLGRRVFGAVMSAGLLASAAFAYVHRDEAPMYFHSLARVCELLIGVVLALVAPAIVRRVDRRTLEVAGYVGLVLLGLIFAEWWTPQPVVTALVACIVILGRPRVLAVAPLVVIGTYSYGLYLWHPISEVLSDRLAVRIALTLALTFVSFHLIELPIRRRLPQPRALTAMAGLSVAAFLIVLLPQSTAPVHFAGTAPVVAAAAEPTTTTTAPVGGGGATRPAPAPGPDAAGASTTTTVARPIRVSAAGDSTQMFADAAWQAFAAAYPDTITWVDPPDDIVAWTSGADGWGNEDAAELGLALAHDGPQGGLDRQGCPLIYDLPIRAVPTFDFEASEKLHSATPISSCDWRQWIPQALATMDLDVLVVSWAVTAMWEYELPDGTAAYAGDPAFDRLLAERMTDFEAMAATYGTRVLWMTYQPISGDAQPARWTTPAAADALATVMLRQPCTSDFRMTVRNDPGFRWYQDGYHLTAEGAARAVAAIVPDVQRCAAA
jgi:peptidoglycan/LPS O-acetylase OafA/YrhL